MKIQNLSTETFADTIENGTKPIIVDFYADWCTPCKMISPIMEQIAKEDDTIDIYRVNVDENPDLAEAFAIMSIPTIISFKESKMYKKIIGVQMKQNILDLVK